MTWEKFSAGKQRYIKGTAFTNKEFINLAGEEIKYRTKEMGRYLQIEEYIRIFEYIHNKVLTEEQRIDLWVEDAIQLFKYNGIYNENDLTEEEQIEEFNKAVCLTN